MVSFSKFFVVFDAVTALSFFRFLSSLIQYVTPSPSFSVNFLSFLYYNLPHPKCKCSQQLCPQAATEEKKSIRDTAYRLCCVLWWEWAEGAVCPHSRAKSKSLEGSFPECEWWTGARDVKGREGLARGDRRERQHRVRGTDQCLLTMLVNFSSFEGLTYTILKLL